MTTTVNTTASGLPTEFAVLEPFSEWIIEKRLDRYNHRLDVTMEAMQAYYDVAFPLLPAMKDYCDQYDINDLPPHVKKLMYMIFSLIEVSFPVECWRQGRVPDTGAATFWDHREPLI